MSLLSPIFFVYPFTQNTIVVTYVTLLTLPYLYIDRNVMSMVVKLVLMLLFHFIATEMKKDTVNSNAMYMVEIENLYVSRNDMLISIF